MAWTIRGEEEFLKKCLRPFRCSQGVDVWHYTSIEAALNIIQTKSLWLTEIRFMNDAAEGQRGSLYLDAAVEAARRQGGRVADFEPSFLRHEVFQRVDEPYLLHSANCVISFTRAPDLLSQWARYAGNGKGVALRFRVDDPAAFPVRYIHPTGPQALDTAPLAQLISAYSEEVEDAERLRNALFVLTIYFALIFKDSFYAEEDEVRVVRAFPASQVQYRAGPYGLTPFGAINLEDPDENITLQEVKLGGLVPEENRRSFRWLLDAYQNRDVEISRSRASLR